MGKKKTPTIEESKAFDKALEEAGEKFFLETIARYAYGYTLTADQYNLVMDLMREFTYQNSYQPPATCSERLERIHNSLCFE
jgi:hypothetical protein